jgi:hypothetical protein
VNNLKLNNSGRKTMLLYSSNKKVGGSKGGKVKHSGSFLNNQSTCQVEEDNEDILDDSMVAEAYEVKTLPDSRQNAGKSQERQINDSIKWGAIMNQKQSNEELEIIKQPPKINENSLKGNLIYKSSPTKMKFNQASLSGPQSAKGKSVQMFKPMKLSSTQNEEGESPEKGSG